MLQLLGSFTNSDANLEQLIRNCVTVMLAAAFICFAVGEVTRNYSQVDKLWSLMPLIYSLISYSAYPSPRLGIMCCLVTIWGLRLSFNFYRKGGYSLVPWRGEEDYRWKIMRQNPKLRGRIRFGIFNLLFISFYQHFLILLFCTPLLLASKYQNSGLTAADLIATVFMLFFIITESIADNQQFRFQKLKKQIDNPTELSVSLKRGFLSEGLWKVVRHPNYISEQGIWVSFYLFGSAASGRLFNWTIIGPLLLVLLFQGSTSLTEQISSEKYSDYPYYKKEVPKFFPRFRFRNRNENSEE